MLPPQPFKIFLTLFYIFLDFPAWVLSLNPTFLSLFIYMCVSVSECMGTPHTGVTGAYEMLDVGTELESSGRAAWVSAA